MAGKATVEIKLSPTQIQAIVDHVTENVIEHRAAELVAERKASIDDAAREEIRQEILREMADRAVRISRLAGHCEEFERMWASMYPDGPYPRDTDGVDCRGWKLSEDGKTEINTNADSKCNDPECCEKERPARTLAKHMWQRRGRYSDRRTEIVQRDNLYSDDIA